MRINNEKKKTRKLREVNVFPLYWLIVLMVTTRCINDIIIIIIIRNPMKVMIVMLTRTQVGRGKNLGINLTVTKLCTVHQIPEYITGIFDNLNYFPFRP